MKPRTGMIAVAAVVLFMANAVFDPKPYVIGDNAVFMLLSRSLSAGTGYQHNGVYAASLPPLLPAMLMPFNTSIVAMKWLIVACGVAAAVLFYRLCLLRWSPRMAFGVTLVAFTNAGILFYTHYVMSEIPFMMFVLAALLWYRRHWALAALLVALACYTRSIGIALVPAVGAAYLLAGRRRDALLFCGAVFVAMLPWSVWVRMHGGGYLAQFMWADPYDPATATLSAAGLVSRVLNNAVSYVTHITSDTLFYASLGLGAGAKLFIAVPALAAVTASLAMRRKDADAIFVFIYGFVLLLWPNVWSCDRFLLPVVPMLYAAIIHAGGTVCAWITSSGR